MFPYIRGHMGNAASRKRGGRGGSGIFERLYAGIVRNSQRRRMIAALHDLDDRLLHDIGLYRGEINSMVNEMMADGEPRTPLPAPSAAVAEVEQNAFRQAA